eukprot:9466099-Pyramimonas_sp.AAC.2
MLDEDFDHASLRHRRRSEPLADGWKAVFARMPPLTPNPLQHSTRGPARARRRSLEGKEAREEG